MKIENFIHLYPANFYKIKLRFVCDSSLRKSLSNVSQFAICNHRKYLLNRSLPSKLQHYIHALKIIYLRFYVHNALLLAVPGF